MSKIEEEKFKVAIVASYNIACRIPKWISRLCDIFFALFFFSFFALDA